MHLLQYYWNYYWNYYIVLVVVYWNYYYYDIILLLFLLLYYYWNLKLTYIISTIETIRSCIFNIIRWYQCYSLLSCHDIGLLWVWVYQKSKWTINLRKNEVPHCALLVPIIITLIFKNNITQHWIMIYYS